MADYQKARVYAAEHLLTGMYDNAVAADNPMVDMGGGLSLTLPPEAKFGSVESIQSYVDRVLALPALSAYSTSPIRVRHRAGERKAHYQAGVIAIHTGRTNWAMRDLVVLHEIAHHLAQGDGHGPRFTAALLDLLDAAMGPEVALAARILFSEGGVDCVPAATKK